MLNCSASRGLTYNVAFWLRVRGETQMVSVKLRNSFTVQLLERQSPLPLRTTRQFDLLNWH